MSQGPNDPRGDRRRNVNPQDAGGRRFAAPGQAQGLRGERREGPRGRRDDDRRKRPPQYSDETVVIDKSFEDYEDIFKPEDPVTVGDRVRSKRRLLLAIALLLIAVIAAYMAFRMVVPSGAQGKEVVVRIKEGAGISSVSDLLAQRDVVPSALGMRVADQLDFKDLDIEAGEYSFRANSSASEAISVLRAGPKSTVSKLTIPEGMRLNQIADKVGEIQGFSSDKFKEVATSGKIRSRYQPQGSTNLEGFLFPDTYLLSTRENEESLLSQMVAQADNQAALSGIDNSLTKLSKTPYETMVLASMIEAEAKTDNDRGQISRVIQNRLFKAMPLQIDATVLYGMGNNKQALSTKDLQVDTPYNTYTRKGLPPTPICNPGRESIEAALNPVQGSWIYYVVKDEEGNHAFADTLEEHNRNAQAAKAKGLY